MKKIEFHVHSIASNDSLLTKFFMCLMCKIKKINCLVITDHNEIWFAQKYKSYFKKNNIDVIVGEEIFTNEGEIIGLFLTEKINPGLSLGETIKLIKKQDGLVYVPHPYDPKRRKTVLKENSMKKYLKEIDFIEMHNGRNYYKETSDKQLEIVENFSSNKVIGSDAHTFYELGRNYCYVDSYDKEFFVSNMKNAVFHKKKCIKIAHLNTKVVKLIKIILRGDINGFVRIIKRKIKKRK